jgi:glucose-1-phosphate cytidylyltransferase
MANYSDGLADLNIHKYLDHFYRQDKIASFLSVKPSQSFHVVSADGDGQVTKLAPVAQTDLWINGGFFVFKQDIFNYIQEGEELVQEPFYRLIEEDQLITYRNQGFWACVDTLKEKKMFDDMYARGDTPWAVWDAVPRNSRYRLNGNGSGKPVETLTENKSTV